MSEEQEITAELNNYSNAQLLAVVKAARRVALGSASGNAEYYQTYWDLGIEEIRQRKLDKQFWAGTP